MSSLPIRFFLKSDTTGDIRKDLSDFSVKKPPQTEVHQSKAKCNIKPIHRFMQKPAEGEYSSHPGVFDLPGNSVIRCKKQWLLKSYRSYRLRCVLCMCE